MFQKGLDVMGITAGQNCRNTLLGCKLGKRVSLFAAHQAVDQRNIHWLAASRNRASWADGTEVTRWPRVSRNSETTICTSASSSTSRICAIDRRPGGWVKLVLS